MHGGFFTHHIIHNVRPRVSIRTADRALGGRDSIDLVEDNCVLACAFSNLKFVNKLSDHQDESRKRCKTRRTICWGGVGLESGEKARVLGQGKALGPNRLATSRVLQNSHNGSADEGDAGGL